MADRDHVAIIAAAAKERLGGLGFTRKGQSRTWISDHGWWLEIVEFQPSGGAAGTYCNTGVDVLWLGHDYLAIEDMERVPSGGHLTTYDASAPQEFEEVVGSMAEQAAQRVQARRSSHGTDDETTLEWLASRRGDIYVDYHAAAAAGLLQHHDDARCAFARVQATEDDRDWVSALKTSASELAALLDSPAAFAAELAVRVARSRSALRLDAADIAWAPPRPTGLAQ